MKTAHVHRTLLAGAAAALLAASLSGCGALGSLFGPGDADRDDDGQVVEGSNIDVFNLRVGDCLGAGVEDEEISEANVVPCSEPHLAEVFHEFDLREGDFPTDDELWDAVFEECDPAFEDFVGVAWEESELDFYPLSPTEGSWSDVDDRLVQCLVVDPAGEVTGTLRGAER